MAKEQHPMPPAPQDRTRRIGRLALRFAPAAILVIGLIVAIMNGALDHLSIHGLRDSRVYLHDAAQHRPLLTGLIYFGIYVAVVTLSLPGGTLAMTLAGGFLFGPWVGGLIADLACTLGAMVAYAVCRLTVGDALDRRANPTFKAFEQGFRKDAFFYLLTLRLIPVTPFWLANIAAGVFGVAVRPFLISTAVGILPASLIYAGLGADLGVLFDRGGRIDSHLMLAPRILVPLVGLALLSVLPLLHHRWRGGGAARDAPIPPDLDQPDP